MSEPEDVLNGLLELLATDKPLVKNAYSALTQAVQVMQSMLVEVRKLRQKEKELRAEVEKLKATPAPAAAASYADTVKATAKLQAVEQSVQKLESKMSALTPDESSEGWKLVGSRQQAPREAPATQQLRFQLCKDSKEKLAAGHQAATKQLMSVLSDLGMPTGGVQRVFPAMQPKQQGGTQPAAGSQGDQQQRNKQPQATLFTMFPAQAALLMAKVRERTTELTNRGFSIRPHLPAVEHRRRAALYAAFGDKLKGHRYHFRNQYREVVVGDHTHALSAEQLAKADGK